MDIFKNYTEYDLSQIPIIGYVRRATEEENNLPLYLLITGGESELSYTSYIYIRMKRIPNIDYLSLSLDARFHSSDRRIYSIIKLEKDDYVNPRYYIFYYEEPCGRIVEHEKKEYEVVFDSNDNSEECVEYEPNRFHGKAYDYIERSKEMKRGY